MLDDYFTRAEILRRHRAGYFGAYLDSCTSLAKERGYPRTSVRAQCHLFRLFGRWLERRGVQPVELDEAIITKFSRAKQHVPLVRAVRTRALLVHRGGSRAAPARHRATHAPARGRWPMSAATLPSLLHSFFTERLLAQRRASSHTVASYRDCFRLLLGFATKRLGKQPSALTLEELDALLISKFLDHLERDRGNSVRSRNVRLAALHSFFRYVAMNEPAHLLHCQRVLAIPNKRYERLSGHMKSGHRRSLQNRPMRRRPRRVEDYSFESFGFKSVALVRQLRGPDLRTWAWWRRRSSMAATAAVSPRSLPQSSTGRLEVMRVLARS